MPNWKRLIVSGSDAALNDLNLDGNLVVLGGATGSFTGSFTGDGTNLTGVTAEWDGSHFGDASITGSLAISGSGIDLTVMGGTVGIGTTSPTAKLHIESEGWQSTTGLANLFRYYSGGHGTLRSTIKIGYGRGTISSPAANQVGDYYNGYAVHSVGTGNVLQNSSGFQIRHTIDSVGSLNAMSTDFMINPTSTGTPVSAIRLEANTGDVGIGTTTPTAKLQVKGAGTTSATTNLLLQNSAASTLMTVLNDGKVGIGTDSPAHKLEVAGDVLIDNTLHFISTKNKIFVDQDTGTGFDFYLNSQNIASLNRNSTSSSQLVLSQYSTGTTADNAPAYSFTGDTNTGMALFGADSLSLTTGGSTKLLVDSSGNVGIGTTSPTAKLEISGDILINKANISNQENLDADIGIEVVAQVVIATYTAAFFDYVIKNGTNVRAGIVYACHDGTNVEFTETSTTDLGSTTDLVLKVDISAGNMRLLASAASDNWIVKTLVRAL